MWLHNPFKKEKASAFRRRTLNPLDSSGAGRHFVAARS